MGVPENPGAGETELLWLVSYGDDDDREMRPAQIAEALRRGEIDGDTIVWRDGTPEWVAIRTVPGLAKLLPTTGMTSNAPAKPMSRMPAPPPEVPAEELPDDPDEPVPVRQSVKPPLPARMTAVQEEEEDEGEPVSLEPDSASGETGGFGAALSAGTLGVAQKKGLPAPPPRRSSAPPPPPEEEEVAPSSGTPSLTSLAAHIAVSDRRPDEELMNLGGSPVLVTGPPTIDVVAALTAPEAPVPEPPKSTTPPDTARTQRSAPSSRKSATATESAAPSSKIVRAPAKSRSVLPWLAVGAAVGLIPFFAMRASAPAAAPEPPRPPEATAAAALPAAPEPAAATPAVPVSATAATPSAAPASLTSATPSAAPAPAAPPAPAATTTPPAVAAQPAPAAQKGATATAQTTATAKPTAEKPAEAPAGAKPAETATAATAAKPAETAAAAPAAADTPADGDPFNVAAAQSALAAAAAQATSCHQEGDPTGTASVRITFSNAGGAMRALIDGPPFAGTATGSCIVAAMKTAKVPAYGGDRVTVTKRVTIQ